MTFPPGLCVLDIDGLEVSADSCVQFVTDPTRTWRVLGVDWQPDYVERDGDWCGNLVAEDGDETAPAPIYWYPVPQAFDIRRA